MILWSACVRQEDDMVVSSAWVWRHDGTLQCGLGKEETLEEARAQLETVIGSGNVIGGEKRQLPGLIIQMCGAPTGQVNAFQLTPSGFWLLFHGFVGPLNFRPWVDEGMVVEGGVDVWPFKSLAGVQENHLSLVGTGAMDPCCIQELYGHRCRAYNVGDPLTEDYRPDRFNVGLEQGRIKELWFG
jgi:hypothetical protein